MTLLATLLADDPPKENAAPPGGIFGNPMFFFAIIGLFMFTMIWLPARRQKKDQAAMLAALKPGAKVLTGSGIIGIIVKLKDGEDEMILRSEDTKLKVTRSSIVRVLGSEEEVKA